MATLSHSGPDECVKTVEILKCVMSFVCVWHQDLSKGLSSFIMQKKNPIKSTIPVFAFLFLHPKKHIKSAFLDKKVSPHMTEE